MSANRLSEKVGNVTVPIYLTGTNGYSGFTVAWYEEGGRRRKFFADLEQARKHAREVATRIENQERQVLRLGPDDARSYSNAIARLKPLGIDLDLAMREFCAAREIVGEHPLIDAAKFWVKHRGSVIEKSVPVIVDELIRGLTADRKSQAHVEEMIRVLTKFAKAFPGNISDITTPEINAYLRGMEASPNSRNVYRRKIVTLFNYARRMGYLPDRTTVATKSAKATRIEEAIEIYSPDEMTLLLNNASENLRPFLVLCGFCGLRAAEAMRADWSEINFHRGAVVVPAAKSKTKSRRIAPLPSNAAAWLRPLAKRSGPVVSIVMIVNALRRLGVKAGVTMKRNGLRHSFCSYRLEITQNANQTALEAGHHVNMLFKHYRELCTPEQAATWFAIAAVEVNEIVAMPIAEAASGLNS